MIFSIGYAASEQHNKAIKILNASEVQEMLTNKEAIVINSLSSIEYQLYHIPGSINVPATLMKDNPDMPENKHEPIIFYCHGYDCPYSEYATRTAIEMGYTNVFWFKGGISEWRKLKYPLFSNEEIFNIKVKKIRPSKLAKLMETNQVDVLDVRPVWWRESIHKELYPIKGTTKSISLIELESRISELDKSRPIIVVDFIMRQSMTAARYLISKGYTVKGVLKGGVRRWKDENYPLDISFEN